MSTSKTCFFLKQWLRWLLIFPHYNTKTELFEYRQYKFVFLLLLLGLLAVIKQVAKHIYHLPCSMYEIFGEVLIFLVMLNHILTNTPQKTQQLNKLFQYMEKLDYDQKSKDSHMKCFCLFWFTFSVFGIIWTALVLIRNESPSIVFQRGVEVYIVYYMEAMVVWRNVLCIKMKRQLEGLNTQLKSIDLHQSGTNERYDLLDQLTTHHNIILNWVDVYNQLLGCPIFLVKVFESYHVLAVLDICLSKYMNSSTMDHTALMMHIMNIYIVVR